ncbi:MAG: tRNA uridine-5-carboxymethylaminomethyl(34) synthesis GTPase MnmE, partial [Bacteroidales bacterium]|nr:tRNA uridine-5-carboxymethylaminomethyl(34) synthesis GTPase MnmE [Bacteroidales bacterium]
MLRNRAVLLKFEDTICAPATIPGTGAITVIRVSGPDTFAVADKVCRCRKGNISTARGFSVKFAEIYDFTAGADAGAMAVVGTSASDVVGASAGFDGRDGTNASVVVGVGADARAEDCNERRESAEDAVCFGADGRADVGVDEDDSGFSRANIGAGLLVDEVLVSIFRAPHSYTGEDSIEINCHASSHVCATILRLLCTAGCRMAGPGEFTRRAFANGKMDLAQAEAVADVVAAASKAQLDVAMNQLRGGISHELKQLRSRFLEITALLELELDFSEEEVEFADRTKLSALVDGAITHIATLADSFEKGNAIKNGIPVAIIGAANTGKSTLLNALVGEQRAIVTDIAGTTRDTIEECFNVGGIIFRFIDTAGLRETSDLVEKIGIQRSLEALAKARIVLIMTDAGLEGPAAADEIKDLLAKIDPKRQSAIILLNKCDKEGHLTAIELAEQLDNSITHCSSRETPLQHWQDNNEQLENSITHCSSRETHHQHWQGNNEQLNSSRSHCNNGETPLQHWQDNNEQLDSSRSHCNNSETPLQHWQDN